MIDCKNEILKDFTPRDENVNLWEEQEARKIIFGTRVEIMLLLQRNNMKIPEELKRWRKIGKKMIEYMNYMEDMNRGLTQIIEHKENNEIANKNKRWTEEEDAMLIEMIGGGESVLKTAEAFNRTPQAISTRVSYLVGIKRISQKVAGEFTGTIDGETITGEIKGEVKKKY